MPDTINVGPTRMLKNMVDAWVYLQDFKIRNTTIMQFDDGDYYYADQVLCQHPDGGRVLMLGNPNDATKVKQHFNKNGVRCSGIVVENQYFLGGVNHMTLICDGHQNPDDLHSMGLFAYYLSGVHAGPELKSNYGSQTRLIIRGFTVGACASKNSVMQIDGVQIENCMIDILVAHGGLIHCANTQLTNSTEPVRHLQGFNGGSVYTEGLNVHDPMFKVLMEDKSNVRGSGIIGPPVANWQILCDDESYVKVYFENSHIKWKGNM